MRGVPPVLLQCVRLNSSSESGCYAADSPLLSPVVYSSVVAIAGGPGCVSGILTLNLISER